VSKDIKVTDKRIFTPEGDLKEEYRHLEESRPRSEPEPGPPQDRSPDGGSLIESPGAGIPRAESGATTSAERPEAAAPGPTADTAPGPGASPEPDLGDEPSFFDLLGILAQPAALYLGDARLPDGRTAEDLELAKLHIDLLEVLRHKTAGNLTPEESSTLEDLLYQLRMRYVRKRR
jgi:hypothetical protein